jgi:hypothetical protein
MTHTSRSDFEITWLSEMPSGLGSFETYDALVYSVNDLLKNNIKKQQVSSNFFKIDLNSSLYYWFEDNNQILLGVYLDKKPQGLIVGLTGKKPSLRGRPPYASDMYGMILKDNDSSIRILSDTQLSDEGFAIWKTLLSKGFKVSVYDRNNPGKSFQTFTSIEQLNDYFKDDDTDYKRYQFVLSEQKNLAECRNFFNIRRYRELSGLSLKD